MNPKKSIIKNKYDKAALNNAQKTAIFLRRIEYSTNMRKNNKNKKPNQEIITKIIIIQKWWKTLYLIILLQKNIRGFLSRTKLIESLEKQENFINMLLHIHWLHKKIVFKRFIRKLYFNDKTTLLLKMINNFIIANLRLLIRKWNFICVKIQKNRNLKIWFEDWKKIVQKFSIVKSMLHNYSKHKTKKSNKDNNINKSFKNLEPKNHKENKNEKEEEIKIKKTIVFSFNKKKNQINNGTDDNFEESEFLNDINNKKENSEIILFKNKRNSVKNLKKFEDITKNEMNKTKILSSRGNDFSNRHDMNKTFTNEKIDKFSKTEIRMNNTKKRINEKIEDKEKDKNKDIDIEKDKNKKNKTKSNKNRLMKRNITSNNTSKILNTNTNKLLNTYNSNTSKDLNTYNSSKVLNKNQISNTPKKEIKSKEIIYNKNLIDVKSNVKNKKKKKEKEKDKDKDKENDNNNVNFIIDPPFQDILKENTQAAIKEKEQNLNTDNFEVKEDDMYNKQFDKDNLINFNSIDDENIKDISFKNEDNLFSNNNEMSNENQKKIKEMVITFEKKPINNYNVSKTEENNIKNPNVENLNNNNKILDNDKNMPNKIQENNKIVENNSKEEYNNLEKPKDRKISDKMGSPTLIKKNNIFQAKIQFQKPTQNILELKQKNNELNQIENNENSNNNNTEIDDDIDNININKELENLSKFKPPSKIKEIVIENLNLNKHNDQRNDDFYTGYNNNIIVEDERRLNHSLSNYELGQDFYMNNLNLTQNYIYTPINERFIKFSHNPNNEVLGYPMPVDQINNFEFRRNNSNNIPNFEQSNEFENNNVNNTFHKKTFSSNNLYQYKHPHLSGMTFTKKIIPNSDVSFSYSNNNFNLRDSQNFNSNNQLNLTLNNGISNSCIPNNFGNKIYMRRVNICPPKNLNKSYIQQIGVNNSKIN